MVIPLNAICTCGHTLAMHVDEHVDYCFTTDCECDEFHWDDGKTE